MYVKILSKLAVTRILQPSPKGRVKYHYHGKNTVINHTLHLCETEGACKHTEEVVKDRMDKLTGIKSNTVVMIEIHIAFYQGKQTARLATVWAMI